MIYLAADHRGFSLKEKIKSWLSTREIAFEDLGADSLDPADDYPDYGAKVAQKVAQNPAENRGILICGSGAGICVVANKFKGIRAALATSPEMARAARNDDDINVLCLASDFIPESAALAITEAFLGTPFGNEERYRRRIGKIADLEK